MKPPVAASPLVLLFTLVLVACGDSSGPADPIDPVEVATVSVGTATLDLVPGEERQLTATARDASGASVAGAAITWASAAPGVVTVDADGRAEGVAPGSTSITARAGSASTTIEVTVDEGGYVDASGANLSFLGGAARLEVPAGAVSSGVPLRVSMESAPPADGRVLAGTALRIEPASVAFGPGTTLTLPFPDDAGAMTDPYRLRLSHAEGSEWTDAPVRPVAVSSREVTGAVDVGGVWAIRAAPETMRSLARERGVDFGAAIAVDPLRTDAEYRELIASEYTSVTPENAMKFGPIHPSPNGWAWEGADAIMEFAADWGMAVHGHVLLWHSQQPGWLQSSNQTRESLLDDLKSHIETVVGRYAGRIATWDVANEVIADDGSGLRSTFWTRIAGADVVDSAFVWAHRADPDARLYLNDYSVEAIGPKSDSLLALAKRLRDSGVPIHGIGIQGHILHDWPARDAISANLARIAAEGFDVRFTELDVRIPDGQDLLAEQAARYRAVAESCVAEPRCTALTTWGATDRYSWVPGWFDGFGRALPFDEFYQPKPAYHAVRESFGG